MRNPNSVDGRQRRSSGFGSTDSPIPIDSSSSSHRSNPGKNPVKVAARMFAGAFSSCFSPPDTNNSTNLTGESDLYQPPSEDYCEKKHGSNRAIYSSSNNSVHMKEPGSLQFTKEEIFKATRNFSPAFKIGQGGFGTVFKGQLSDGTIVAVKRAKKIVFDNHVGVEFQSEIQILSQVKHLNLVRFYGYLENGDERIVVVEYVPNGTLREHLDCVHGTVLDFAARLDIAIDVADAVTYLHMFTEHPIIHRDIKSSNILITEKLRAKVADFGFARLAADSDSGDTHVSTQVKGTAGYLDPEYLRTYQLTDKSDVYSFGVLLVELVTGRRPIEPKRELNERITVRWAMKKFGNGDAIVTLDPRLDRSSANSVALEKILELSLECLAPHRRSRPAMRGCAEILWKIRKDYKEVKG